MYVSDPRPMTPPDDPRARAIDNLRDKWLDSGVPEDVCEECELHGYECRKQSRFHDDECPGVEAEVERGSDE